MKISSSSKTLGLGYTNGSGESARSQVILTPLGKLEDGGGQVGPRGGRKVGGGEPWRGDNENNLKVSAEEMGFSKCSQPVLAKC